MNSNPKRRLGRGLAALIGDDVNEESVFETARREGLKTGPIANLFPNPNNPRVHFDEERLEELADSIRRKGLLQPILVRPARGDDYEIVAGERRWRAAQRAGLHEGPVVVHDLDEAEALEVALIENIQRADLNPLEEARGYAQLIDMFGYTQHQLAEVLGKSRSHIANTMRLLNLPDEVQKMIRDGELSAGHARALIATPDPVALARRIARLKLSVREAEKLARRESGAKARGRDGATERGGGKSPDIRALEKRLEEALGLSVEIVEKGRGGGRVSIAYTTLEQLDDICRRLAGTAVD